MISQVTNLAETDNQSANKGDIEQIMYLHGYAGAKRMITRLDNVAISIQLLRREFILITVLFFLTLFVTSGG